MMKTSLLDTLVYRNLFDICELLLDMVNINVGNQEKRTRIKQSFLMITRRQKNRIVTGFLQISNEKRLGFLIGCFKENTDLLRKRVEIIEDLSEELKAKICKEIYEFTDEKIKMISDTWAEKGLDKLTDEQMAQEVKQWVAWSR